MTDPLPAALERLQSLRGWGSSAGAGQAQVDLLLVVTRVEAFDQVLADRDRAYDALEEIAAQEARNRDYYRGLVVEIGELFGVAAKTADDGGIAEDVLCAKVPALVEQALAALRMLYEAIEDRRGPLTPGRLGTIHERRSTLEEALLKARALLPPPAPTEARDGE